MWPRRWGSRQCGHRWVARFDSEGDARVVGSVLSAQVLAEGTPAERVARIRACRDSQRVGRDEVAAHRYPAPDGVADPGPPRPPAAGLAGPNHWATDRASRSAALRHERQAPARASCDAVTGMGALPKTLVWRVIPAPRNAHVEAGSTAHCDARGCVFSADLWAMASLSAEVTAMGDARLRSRTSSRPGPRRRPPSWQEGCCRNARGHV